MKREISYLDDNNIKEINGGYEKMVQMKKYLVIAVIAFAVLYISLHVDKIREMLDLPVTG